jgi:hypothetical protein
MRTRKKFFVCLFFSGLIILSCDSDDGIPVLTEIRSRVDVKAQVGNVLYENVDAIISVQALSESGETQWSDELDYISSSEETSYVMIPAGYHRYVITASVWGATESQTFTSQQLFDQRADGPGAVTYVFAPAVPAPKLTRVIKKMQQLPGGEFLPYRKTEYEWEDGKVSRILDYEYNAETESFFLSRHSSLTYSENRVVKMSGYHADNNELYIETLYEYNASGNISRIKESNSEAGVNTEVNLTWDYPHQSAKAVFEFSNGEGFIYDFSLTEKNISADKTREGSSVCNEGSYEFDRNINPYRHLGYVDLLLGNISINNKTSEDVQYLACSFPQVVVESYDYTYAESGYPLSGTAHYSNGADGIEEYSYEME